VRGGPAGLVAQWKPDYVHPLQVDQLQRLAMTTAGANQHQVTNGPGNADLETDSDWRPGGHWIAF
jgi:hypothetical protein